MKRFIALVLSLVMALSLCAPAWATEGAVVVADTAALQAALDEVASGDTIQLTAGVAYGAVTVRPTAANGTVMYCGSECDFTTTDAEEFKAHLGDGKWHPTPDYTNTLSDVTIIGAEGATVAGLLITSGHAYGEDVYDYVRDMDPVGTSVYYNTFNISGLTFENVAFTGKIDINTSDADTVYDGVTFDGCSFTTGGTASGNGAAIRYYNEANNGNVKNLTVKNCYFENCYQGVYTGHVNGITVTDCTFETLGHNAVAVQDQGSCDHGNVVISGNEFKNVGDRVIRFNNVGAGSNITIKNNTATNSGDDGKEVIKATSIASGVTCDVAGNNWGEGAVVVNPEFKAPVAEVNGVKFKTLAEAVAVGGTVELLTNVTLEKHVNISKDTVINLNGYNIAKTEGNTIFYVTDGADLTINGTGVETISLENAGGAYAIWSAGNGIEANEITLNQVTVEATTCGVYHNGNDFGAKVTIEKSTVKGGGAGVFLSGSEAWADPQNNKMNDLVITDSTIEGASAVEVKHGNVIVDNSTLKATGEPDVRNYGNGSCTEGYALALTNNGMENAAEASTGSVLINSGNFTGNIGIKDDDTTAMVENTTTAKIQISGGTFSADPKAYVVEGYKAVGGNGVYTVMKTYNVTFDANGGKGEYTLAPVVEGKLVLPANPFTAPKDKIFKAWSVDGAEYAAGEEITVAADVEVVAVWMNAPAPVEDTEVMVQVAPPEVTVSDKITGDALEIAQKVEVSEICTDAMTEVVKDVAKEEVTVKDEQIADLADKLNTTAEAIEDKVVVVVQTNFEVEIQDVIMDDNGAAAVKLDITPVYQKVVTTETVVESGAKVEVGKNAVAIEDEDAKGELDLKGQNVEITISIPGALVNAAASNGNKLYVTHTKDDAAKTSFVYVATVDPIAKTATFVNPNGFSTFTLSTTNSAVAYVKDSDTSYATIESAISDAGKGAVIEVLVSDQVVNITAPCSFKLKWADNITEPTFNVAKGYTMSKWYVNGVYTYIVQSASAGGYAPSTTPEKVVTSADTFDAGIALYVGMSLMAAAGSAVVLKKRED